MAEVSSERFKEYNLEDTVNWLCSQELITETQKTALKTTTCTPEFRGVSDLLPFLEDDGVINFQAVLEEVAGGTKFSLRSVARIKQEMRGVDVGNGFLPELHGRRKVQPDCGNVG